MAKKQNFIVGSTNPNTNTWTSSQLNNGWNKYQVLKSGDLDGVFNAVSDYSNDSSQEIWNAIYILKGSNPTGTSTSELGNIISTVLGTKATKATDFITPLTSSNKGATQADLNTLREEIETSSLTFKGYIATSAPSASTYGLVQGNIWINASEMPTTFPVAASSIRVWNGTSWDTTTETYTAKDFDFFRNINDNEGYYWFGGQWTVMSTDMSTTYFTLNQTSGKWEIKSSVNLPGAPTTTTAATTDNSTKIATTAFVNNVLEGYVPTGGAANTSLSNLVDAGKNISNWSSNVSNCITEIPQDIKLELNNGTLTLKAGSKVYVPNGSGVFDEVVIENDLTKTATYLNNTQGFVYLTNNNTIDVLWVGYGFSGEVPSFSSDAPQYQLWYDNLLGNNSVKYSIDYGNSWTSGQSLPLALVTGSSTGITSIDQVFNGFGFIGDAIFATPGVKVLIPDGRNEDGTLKNIKFTLSTVTQSEMPKSRTSNGCFLGITSTGTLLGRRPYLTPQPYYDYHNNVFVWPGTNEKVALCGTFADAQRWGYEVITKITPKTNFQAVDYNLLLELLYPVGSIYIGTQEICPLVALIPGSTWEIVGENRALWGGNGLNANTTIAAGLPNITGSIDLTGMSDHTTSTYNSNNVATSALYNNESITAGKYHTDSASASGYNRIRLNASRSNSIYGNSTTVQPPAYVVNVWRRTA